MSAGDVQGVPERIWIDEDTWFAGPGKTERATEYVRADVVEAREWKTMTDWSGLPDFYVTKAECQQGMFWRIEACSVPMAIGPEVRLVPAHKLTGASALDGDALAKLIREAEAEGMERAAEIAWSSRAGVDDIDRPWLEWVTETSRVVAHDVGSEIRNRLYAEAAAIRGEGK